MFSNLGDLRGSCPQVGEDSGSEMSSGAEEAEARSGSDLEERAEHGDKSGTDAEEEEEEEKSGSDMEVEEEEEDEDDGVKSGSDAQSDSDAARDNLVSQRGGPSSVATDLHAVIMLCFESPTRLVQKYGKFCTATLHKRLGSSARETIALGPMMGNSSVFSRKGMSRAGSRWRTEMGAKTMSPARCAVCGCVCAGVCVCVLELSLQNAIRQC